MTAVPYPPEIVRALRLWPALDENPPTAYLADVGEVFGYLVGRVYGDIYCRFLDGRQISTSPIVSLSSQFGYLVAYTLSGSRYVIVTFRQEQYQLFEGYLRRLHEGAQ